MFDTFPNLPSMNHPHTRTEHPHNRDAGAEDHQHHAPYVIRACDAGGAPPHPTIVDDLFPCGCSTPATTTLDHTESTRTEHPHDLRKPCSKCGSATGRIATKAGQDCVYCLQCGRFQYNAPRTETGRTTRSVTTVHSAIKARQRARIIMRATGRCELCGSQKNLHVGHLLSVEAGLKLGLTEVELNDDENLAAMCERCNLGIGKIPVPARLLAALIMSRVSLGNDEAVRITKGSQK